MRIFKCKKCHHHLRYGTNDCSICYTPSPIANRKWALPAFLVVIIGLVAVLISFF
ncbi:MULTISPECIES: hypothetical protein [Martelella]|uniref:Uncharacterized protein n=1 Tax=Martelella mediterranea DSM 17316 TaxID=1122214 RepID=A0A1U9Z105_9HYPH|nr:MULTISPECIES: hypothetical protein [Martelella]AQZ51348.1 hypothetical protein Mame_02008 [Martelella mediterranea DSM 17316]|tara:strand:- start:2705 stop:2869 length:165 start_codon:yes stop_codon:yes gene_type:complete